MLRTDPSCAVLINYWGGVPVSTASWLVQQQQAWASDCRLGQVLLPAVSPLAESSLDACTEFSAAPFLRAAQERGWAVTVLGAHGGNRSPPMPEARATASSSFHLPDPRHRLQQAPWNLHPGAVCSLLDGASYDQGSSATAHDEEVLAQAQQWLTGVPSRPAKQLLWINLLGCRDMLALARRRHAAQPVTAKPPADPLQALLPELAQLLGAEQGDGPGRVPDGWFPVTASERATLEGYAKESLQRLQERTRALAAACLEIGGSVACTATRMLSTGEHGVCTDRMPVSACCETFWCSSGWGGQASEQHAEGAEQPSSSSSLSSSRPASVPLKECLDSLWEGTEPPAPVGKKAAEPRSFKARPAAPRGPGEAPPKASTLLLLPEGRAPLLRVVCPNVRGHTYACVCRLSHSVNSALQCVYDLSVDPEERQPLQEEVHHLRDLLLRQCAEDLHAWSLLLQQRQPHSKGVDPLPAAAPRPSPAPERAPAAAQPLPARADSVAFSLENSQPPSAAEEGPQGTAAEAGSEPRARAAPPRSNRRDRPEPPKLSVRGMEQRMHKRRRD